mgnify:CR=1 FL=1
MTSAAKPLDLTKITKKLISIIQNAGNIAQDFFLKKNFTIEKKKDLSPVTSADMTVHNFIVKEIKKISSFPIISEESFDNEVKDNFLQYWLIDPIDGTDNFINNRVEFCINISLIINKKPVIGIIENPMTKETFIASKGKGSFRLYKDEKVKLPNIKNKKLVRLKSHNLDAPFKNNKVQDEIKSFHQIKMGSALKYCLLAEGTADIYIKQNNISTWDTAAGQCIVEESGGKIIDFQGDPLEYISSQSKNPSFLALSKEALYLKKLL